MTLSLFKKFNGLPKRTTRYVKFIEKIHPFPGEPIRWICHDTNKRNLIVTIEPYSHDPVPLTVGIAERINNSWVITSFDCWGNGIDPLFAYFGGDTHKTFKRVQCPICHKPIEFDEEWVGCNTCYKDVCGDCIRMHEGLLTCKDCAEKDKGETK